MVDDPPMADQHIRSDYEAALGAFILTFNEADFYISQIIGWELQRSGLEQKLNRLTEGSISARIDIAEAIAARSAEPSTANLRLDRLRAINNARNQLAHGHFDQNPFEGSYQIIVKRRHLDFPAARVRTLTAELDGIVDTLRNAYYGYFFSDLDAEQPGHG